MNVLKQIQQGDVWIEKVDDFIGHTTRQSTQFGFRDVTVDATGNEVLRRKLDNTQIRSEHILAAGEATGHHHRLVVDLKTDDITVAVRPAGIKVDMDNGIFELMEKAILNHEEHLPLELEPGLYRFGIIQEYDYEAKQNRRVYD